MEVKELGINSKKQKQIKKYQKSPKGQQALEKAKRNLKLRKNRRPFAEQGRRLKEILETSLGIRSTQGLAKKLGVSWRTMDLWLNGATIPRANNFKKIEELTQVDTGPLQASYKKANAVFQLQRLEERKQGEE